VTAPSADPVLTLQELRNAVELLERAALAARGATAEELDARRPGGAAYPDPSPGAWLSYHGWLGMRAAGGERPSTTRDLAAVALDAAADAPIPVQLRTGETVHVQPKSANALLLMRALDAEWRRVGPQVAALLDGEDPVPESVHAAVWAAVLQAQSLQLWVWAAIEGVDLPFDVRGSEPTPPAITTQIRAADLLRLMEAHVQINYSDLEILAAAFPVRDSDERRARSLEDTLAAIASEHGVPTSTLFTGRTVRGLYHQALVTARIADDAKRDRARRGS
jgi:hypothetical protein